MRNIRAEAKQDNRVNNSLSGSSNGSSGACGVMYLVKLSLEGQQQPPGSAGPKRVTLRSCNQYTTVSHGIVNKTITYTYVASVGVCY